jgi:uncharacterized protein YutE (UPF0331/DUF86 family)
MMPSLISRRIIGDRLALITEMLHDLRSLPLGTLEQFLQERRDVAAAESYLRRSLEALLDIGRHILAKGFAVGTSEYKEIATRLEQHYVLSTEEANLLRRMAGYRNRLVHFYHEISPEELYRICLDNLSDIESIQDAYRRWVNEHPEKVEPGVSP